jgi:hypothetical protein
LGSTSCLQHQLARSAVLDLDDAGDSRTTGAFEGFFTGLERELVYGLAKPFLDLRTAVL